MNENLDHNRMQFSVLFGQNDMIIFDPPKFLVLVVDDISQNLQVVGAILDKVGYDTNFAMDSNQAMQRLQSRHPPDLILLDLMMPDIDGLTFCKQLKQNDEYKEIPVIFLTASSNRDNLLQGFEAGAVDYVTKPFNSSELLARVKTHLELKRTRDLLQSALAELQLIAILDPLTGIPNRRHIFAFAETEINRSNRYDYDLSVLMIDIDHFKQVNDTYHHLAGDEALKLMVQVTLQELRSEDCFGRFGGEEFVVLLPQTNINAAQIVAERIRLNLERTPLVVENLQINLTISIGVTQYHLEDIDINPALKRADDALMEAKRRGRNRVIVQEFSPRREAISPAS